MKRTTFAMALAAILVSACGASSTSAGRSPAASTAVAAASSNGALACRLPVAGYAAPLSKQQTESGAGGLTSQKGRGGFLDLPSGRFTPIADSDTSYLAKAHAWVPASWQAISPDQTSYVEARAPRSSSGPPTTTLYVIQVRTKAERKLFVAPEGQMAFVPAFTSRGIYVVTISSVGPGPAQMLFIDPTTGAQQTVPGSQAQAGALQEIYTAVSGDFAWGTVITGSQQQPSFQLVRLDLTDGTIVVWNHSAGAYIVIGFDEDGHPIVGTQVSATGAGLLLLSAPDQSTTIPTKGGAFLLGRGTPVNDAHGTWFGSGDGSIWLYKSARGMEKVASVPPQPGGTGQPYDPHAWRSVAGPCL